MKLSLLWICMFLIATVGAPVAKANPTTYTISFSGSAPFPTAGSFTYDPSTQTFSSFLVTWNAITFDLTSSANAPSLSGSPCAPLTGGAATFALLSGNCALDTVDWFAHVSPRPEFGFTTFVDPSDSILVWANAGSPTAPYYVAGGTWTITQTTATPTITSPVSGSTLSGSTVTFDWTPGTGAVSYQIWVGSTAGAHDLAVVTTTGLSAIVSNLPTNGSTLYVRLYTYNGSIWTYTSSTYRAATIAQAAITNPANGSTLSGSTATFNWTAGPGIVSYQIWVGSTAGAHDVAVIITPGLSAVVTNLPTDGSTLYVTLYSYNGSSWSYSSYTYRAATTAQAVITSPVNGSILSGSRVTFNWTAGAGVVSYQLWVGSTAGAHDLAVVTTPSLSAIVSNLPTNGSTLYVRLYSYHGSVWTYSLYTYRSATIAQAAISSPANGSTLSGSTVTFHWTAGTGVVSYQIWVGRSPGAHDVAVVTTPGLSAIVTNLPTDGSTLYVTLYSYNGSIWTYSAYTYTAATIAQAVITSPANGSTLGGSTVTFNWTAGTGVVSYQIWVGRSPGAHDVAVVTTPSLSAIVSNLPMDSSTLYVTLYSYNGSIWTYSSYTYKAA